MAQAPARCLNHVDRTAVARCKQCHKPLCSKCVIKKPGGIYCSEECFEKMGSFQERVERLDEKPARGFSVGKLVTRLIILAIVVGIAYFVFVVQEVRSIGDLIAMFKALIP